MSCPGRLVRERIDPIVNPGAVSGHLHTISGGSGFGPSMTFEQARNSTCSSCQIKEDMSNYWTPQLYVKKKDGTFQPVPVVGDGKDANGGMTVYYLQRGEDGEKLHAFPEGFRMLAGDTFKRNFTGGLDAQAISFACLGAGKDETNEIPNYNCPGGLRAQIFFPACWNGNDLDSLDHRSHVSYPAGKNYNTGACPKEFPVHLISIFYEILYDIDQFEDQWTGDQHPFVFANGDPTGYGFHGDFVNGWNVGTLQKAVDTCLDDSGAVSKCDAVTMYTDAECNACKLPELINEQVDGSLEELPGCNPITSGPEPAILITDCAATKVIGPPKTNYVDLTSSKQWEYVGCGKDNIDGRAFTGESTSSDDMTVEKCVDFCSSNGFSYAGVEYGRECFCDNAMKPENAPKDGVMGSCTMKCAGNNTQFCGNGGAMSIYHKCSSTSCRNAQIERSGTSDNNAPQPPAPSKASSTQAPSAQPTNASVTTKRSNTAYSTKAPSCPRNNCVNQIFNPTASVPAKTFCATYTKSAVLAASAIPKYLNNCGGSAEKVSSACSCLMYPTNAPKAGRYARQLV
ncbi:WSC-domain-containing protein [Aaosphaeria arxii CBS 175.79]|uniref:WSC-domain-containing protein n=1 Tax=Aaosphaeria arxii CBS 175.79 TaxID=1450172 RepID=A0A6A5XQB9_9PLEO|nr:WSC-domain-containing protein [Aaosphaeria arxii CBS 175.79]KAF2015096.1 WSC-domain-containing protein [Aaosphaeria arxii CBS 175.79]